MVCLNYDEGWFLRINSEDKFQPCVAISKKENTFLKHDSHVECRLLIIDEFELEEELKRKGVIGSVHPNAKDGILKKLLGLGYINKADKDELKRIFSEN